MKHRKISIKVLFCVLMIVCMGMSTIAAAAKQYQIPSKEYTELKYRNDRGEKLKFYGSKSFQMQWTKEFSDGVDIVTNKAKDRIIVTQGHTIVSYDLNGKVQWRYTLPSYSFNYYSLLTGADGTIYAVQRPNKLLDEYESGHVAALSEQGKLLWESALDNPKATAFLEFGGNSKGTFVTFNDDGIIGIKNGAIAWTNAEILQLTVTDYGDFQISSSNIRGMFADRQGRTFIQTDAKLYAVDDAGKILWSRDIKGDMTPVQQDKYLLYTPASGPLVLIDSATGKNVSGVAVNPQWLNETGLPIDRKGGLYVSNELRASKNGISKINVKGNPIWSYKIRFQGYAAASELVSDASGNVFFTDSGGSFYSLDKDGNERFIILYREKSGPNLTRSVIGKDGNVYVLLDNIGLTKISAIAAK